MRCFRLYQRSIKTGKIIKHRDYVGLKNLQKHGKETYERYNRPGSDWFPTTAELSENIEGKWQKLDIKETNKLIYGAE